MRNRNQALAALLSAACFIAAQASAKPLKLKPLVNDNSRAEIANFDLEAHGDLSKKVTGPFVFPTDADDGIYGIDVSHHNGIVDWTALSSANGVQYVFIKASQGGAYQDSRFERNWRESGKIKGLKRGAYHFLSAGVSGKTQAAAYLQVLRSAGGLKKGDLRPVLDIEWDCPTTCNGKNDRWSKYSRAQIIKIANDWIAAVRAGTGKDPIIYTSASWWGEHVKPDALLETPIWIADYSKSAIKHETPASIGSHFYSAWQFSDHATIGSGKAKFDANKLVGMDIKLLEGN